MKMFGSLALPLYAFSATKPALAYDAQIILNNAEELAKALNDLASRNPAVHRVLHLMMNGTDSMVLLTAVANIAIPIAANHGLLQPAMAELVGAPNPQEFAQERSKPSKTAA
jgi:hypothetical protein